MTTSRGTEVDELPPPGRVRRVLGWVAVPVACLLALYFVVIPAWVWGSAGISGLFAIRAEAEVAGGFVWLTIALVPTGVWWLMGGGRGAWRKGMSLRLPRHSSSRSWRRGVRVVENYRFARVGLSTGGQFLL